MTKRRRLTKRETAEIAEQHHKIKVACIGIAIFVVFFALMVLT